MRSRGGMGFCHSLIEYLADCLTQIREERLGG